MPELLARIPNVRILGDIHGKLGMYCNLAGMAEYSVCVGDVGFNYDFINKHLDPIHHRIVGGNHDNYDNLSPHFLGDFGEHSFTLSTGRVFKFFYIRGAYSVDKHMRTPGVSWWSQEELNHVQSSAAISAYALAKPDFVISHDCPAEIVSFVVSNRFKMDHSHTNKLLQACFDIHKPKKWYMGHHHNNVRYHHRSGTEFRCLAELSCEDV